MRRIRNGGYLSVAALVLWAAVAPVAGAGLGFPMPASASASGFESRVAAALPGASSAQLTERFNSLVAERDRVDADLQGATDAEAAASARIYSRRAKRDGAIGTENQALSRLSRYSVSAYVGGGILQSDLTAALLTSPGGDLDAEGKRVLSTSVHSELVGRVRNATSDLNGIDADLKATEAMAADLQRQARDLADRRATLTDEINRTSIEIQQARNAEAAEAADRARRAADEQQRAADDARRASTPRPESIRSGVIPAPSVRADIIAKLGGEIPRTALDAYWRSARLVNAARPGCDVDWALIGAIGRVETSHGTYMGTVLAPDGSTSPTILGIPLDGRNGTARIPDTDGGALDGDPVYDRAVGPMQFIPTTWRAFAADGNGDGVADPHNIYDASMATGNYLCATAGGSIAIIENASRAVFAYNRSMEYNAQVLTLADHYRRTVDPSLPPLTTPPAVPPDTGNLPPPASPGPGPEPPPPPTSSTTSTSTTTTTTPTSGP